jgi:AcrR family transcriptional regulator
MKSRRDEYAEATRQALLDAGKAIFAAEGFQAAGIEAISRSARVTRGAFYHHFEDKKALFDAVVVSLQKAVSAQISARAKQHQDIRVRLDVGIDAYLDACEDPVYGRIVIQDGQAALGMARYREIEETWPLALLVATLRALQRDGVIASGNIELLGRLLDAMICKIALLLPEAEDPKALRAEGKAVLTAFIDSLCSTATA